MSEKVLARLGISLDDSEDLKTVSNLLGAASFQMQSSMSCMPMKVAYGSAGLCDAQQQPYIRIAAAGREGSDANGAGLPLLPLQLGAGPMALMLEWVII
jgi:hypothetical protein